MKVRHPPAKFTTGGTLSALDVNRSFAAIAHTIEDVAQKRYAHFNISFPYQRSTTTAYTASDTDGVREYWIRFPTRVSIERAFFRYYGTGDGTNPVTISIYDSGGTVVEDEYLSVSPTASAASLSDFNGKRVELTAATYYRVRIESAGTFSSTNTVVELHFRADRFNTASSDNTPNYEPQKFSAADALDASEFNAETTAIDTEVAKFATYDTFTRAELYVAHDVATGDSADLTTWQLPVADSDVTSRTFVQMVARRECDPSPGVNTGGVWRLVNAAAATEQSANVIGTGTGASAVTTATETIATVGGDHNDNTEDWTIEFEHTTGTDVVDKTYVLLIYE